MNARHLLPAPVQMTLFVAFPCNLRCKNCWLFGIADTPRDYMGTPDKDIMSWETFRAAVDPLFGHGAVPSICFMGGEPMLHARIVDMIRHIKEQGPAYVDMNTNGTRLDKLGREMVKAGIDALYVSLDGSTPEINDASRGIGSFERAVHGIEAVRDLRDEGMPVKVAINYTVTCENYRDLERLGDLARRLAVDELFVNLSVFVTPEEGAAAQRTLHEELGMRFDSWRGFMIGPIIEGIDSQELVAQLGALRHNAGDVPTFVQPVGYSAEELGHYFTPQWKDVVREKACPVQTFRTTVLPNGDVVPCTLYPDVVVGNLRRTSLMEVWHGEEYARFRALVEDRLLPTCHRCCDLFDETKGDPAAFVTNSRLQYRL